MPRSHLRSSRQAFTLIELLVVMAIIATLAALLMPGISMVKSAANSAKCASNLRQIYFGVLGYCDDHNGRLPPSDLDNPSGAGDIFWFASIGPYVEAGYQSSNHYYDLRQRNVLWGCPAYKPNPTILWDCGYGMNAHPDKENRPNATSYCRYDSNNPSTQQPLPNVIGWGNYTVFRLDAITYPSTRPLVGDASYWAMARPTTYKGRHKGKVGTVFFDGHVESIPYARQRALLNNPKTP